MSRHADGEVKYGERADGNHQSITPSKRRADSISSHRKCAMEITSRIAEYITTADREDFPAEAVIAAKGAIMDCLACMLAGSEESLAKILCQYARAEGGQPVASVVG